MHANEFLQAGLQHMQDRAKTYDKPQGERSMGMTMALANILLADKLREPLSEEDGWNIMQLLKLVRSKQGEFKADNYEDGSAYAGLAGEAAFNERSVPVDPMRHEAAACQTTDGGRNPLYEGLFDGETEQQRAQRLSSALTLIRQMPGEPEAPKVEQP